MRVRWVCMGISCFFLMATCFAQSVSIPCGVFNPHGSIDVRDNTGNQEFKDTTQLSPPALVSGQSYSFVDNNGKPLQFGYLYNGNGRASVSGEATCTQTEQHEQLVKTRIEWSAILAVGNDDCCSGFQPGGHAEVAVTWDATITLPGNHDTDKWTLDAAIDDYTPSWPVHCALIVDGKPGTSWELIAGARAHTVDLIAGSHTLAYSCPGDSISQFGYAGTKSSTEKGSLTLTLRKH